MAYDASNLAQGIAGAAIGNEMFGVQASNAPPRTLASAGARIDMLNDRLMKSCESLGAISAAIGAMTPVSGINPAKNGQSSPVGAIHRINDAADAAHDKLADIENYIQSIVRALG